jgi:hypothetical protein
VKPGNPHKRPRHGHVWDPHPTTELLPDLGCFLVAVDAQSGEPFDIKLSPDGNTIVWLRPLTAAGRALMPASGIHTWAHRRGWWLDPPQRRTA